MLNSNSSSYFRDRFDWPVSSVKSRRVVKLRRARQLDAIEVLGLSPQDRGYLRLARLLLEAESGQGSESEAKSRPGAGWDQGLVS
jgi:hypothetical protein